MNNEQIKALAEIAKNMIWAMGMQAENTQRAMDGNSMAYNDEHFYQAVEAIDTAMESLKGGEQA